MAVVDLYSPRIQEEGLRQRHAADLLVQTTGEAAKQLFQYSINKQEIDKAYAELDAKAEQIKRQTFWDDKLKSNELATRRFNAAKVGLTQNPDDEAAWQVLSDAMFDYSGIRPDPARKKDIIDHLSNLTIDQNTGGYTPEAQRIIADAKKPESETGKLISDMMKLRESGVPEDDSRIQNIRDQLAKNASIELGGWAGTYLSSLPPEKAAAIYEYWKTLGPPGSGTNVTLKPPAEGERKDLVDYVVLNKKTEILRNKWNRIQTKYANVLNTPTGMGAESIQNMFQRAGIGDPEIADFQKSINDFQNEYLRVLSGKVLTVGEANRLIGGMVSGGSLISPTQDPVTFQKVLDINTDTIIQRLQAMKEVQTESGLRVPDVVPETPGKTPPPPAAKDGNQNPVDPRDKRATELDDIRKQREQIRKDLEKRRQERSSGGRPKTPPPTVEPQSMLFNRSLTYRTG